MTEDTSKALILIVEDDPSMGKTLELILKRSGYRTKRITTGQEAILSVQGENPQNLPNVALIDIRLPDINGLEVLKSIKRAHPDVGAIMMTGFANIQTSVEALNDGASAYIQKPYNIDEVKALIEKALEKQRLIRENQSLMKKLQEWNIELERTVQAKTAELKSKNLTLLEMIEKLKIHSEAKSRFVANASHELRTPMTSILGFSSMLLEYWEKLEKGQVSRFLQIIRDESQRLTRLTKDLLDLSRMQEGRMRLDFKEVDLEKMSHSIIGNLKMVKESVKVNVSIDDDAKKIITDQDKLQQVFTNLLSNALKYSPENTEVKLIIKKKGQLTIVSVLDQGPGIPDDQRGKIFEPFYRMQDDVSKKVRGTGLGLSISKAIIEALGGVIRVESELGKGSNFTFILPKGAQESHERKENKI